MCATSLTELLGDANDGHLKIPHVLMTRPTMLTWACPSANYFADIINLAFTLSDLFKIQSKLGSGGEGL